MSEKEKDIAQNIYSNSITMPNTINNSSKNNINNINSQYLHTNQHYNTPQQIFDFISDRGKISLKSYFDQKGCNEFLKGKREAMKKIELNENILEENKDFSSSNKQIEKNINKRQIKNTNINDKNNKLKKDFVDNSNIKNSRTQTNIIRSRLNKYLDNGTEIEEKRHKSPKIRKVKSKKKNKKNCLDENSINSKFFNNYKEYQRSQNMLSKEDLLIFEEILTDLKENK